MEFINLKKNIVSSKMPFLEKKIRDTFGDRGVSLYGILNEGKLFFVIMCSGVGLLINDKGESFKFKSGANGSLGMIEKDKRIIKPKINLDYLNGKEFDNSVSIVDKDGNKKELCLTSSGDSFCTDRVSFAQFNKHKDMTCIINYGYNFNEDTIFPGLLNKIESVYIYKDVSTKGDFCRWGLVPSRMQVYSRNIIGSESLNYSFISFSEEGILRTMLNGSYNLYNGSRRIVRYCKLGFMNKNHQLIELPWPFGKYLREEDLLNLIKENGFMVDVPDELIKVFNEQDTNINILKNFLSEFKAHKKDRKYICLQK